MIFATNNKGKLKEIREILKEVPIKSLADASIFIDVIEDQDTFYGNALKKAKEIYKLTKEAVIADDSGLIVKETLDWPGVLTSRFLGEDKTDEEKNLAIISKANTLENKGAQVICTLVYYDGVREIVGEGILEGQIVDKPRGENGFGFDSIFELSNGKTLAELTAEEKNNCSARFLAAKNLRTKLVKQKVLR